MTIAKSFDMDRPDIGILVSNFNDVRTLRLVLSQGGQSLQRIPSLMARMIRKGTWMHWLDTDTGHEQIWRPCDFRWFITEPDPEGLGTPLAIAARFFTDGTQAHAEFHDAVRGEVGGNNPSGKNQHSEVDKSNRLFNQGAVEDSPSTIPILAPKTKATQTPCGTTVNYGIRRLKKERPDLLDEVKSGNLTVNAAAIEAGFRKQALTIPANPIDGARVLAMHFQGDALEQLIAALQGYLGQPRPVPVRGRPRKDQAARGV